MLVTAHYPLRHPERSEGSPDLAPSLLLEIPHCVRDDVCSGRVVTHVDTYSIYIVSTYSRTMAWVSDNSRQDHDVRDVRKCVALIPPWRDQD